MNWYLGVLRKYAVFEGRARRKEYWFFVLFNLLATIALTFVDTAVGTFYAERGYGLLTGLYCLGVLLPGIGVAVRRLHDIGRTGWWLLIALVPIIGPIVLLIFAVLDSQMGGNRYGPNPKTATV